MTSKFRTYFIGGSYATLVEIIDNVPNAISPVSARPVYIQLPESDKTFLMDAWKVSVLNYILFNSF